MNPTSNHSVEPLTAPIARDLPAGVSVRRNLHGAFTLIEVIVVLVLIAMIAGMAFHSVGRSNASLAGASSLMAAHLRYVQIRALGDVDPWRLEFVDSGSYRIGRVGGEWERIPSGEGDLHRLPDNITVSPTGEVRFDTWGRPVSVDGVPWNEDFSLTLNDGFRTVTVVVGAGTGFVR